FDQHLPRPPSFCQVFDLGFQVRVVDTASPDVEEIPVAVVCPKPRGADRPIIVGAALCGRVPTLQDKLAEGCRGWFSVALNPLAFDHRAARGNGCLLVLSRKKVRAELTTNLFQDLSRLTLRRDNLARTAMVNLPHG